MIVLWPLEILIIVTILHVFFLSNDESHFDELVDTMLPYMLPGMEEVVYVGGRQQRLARELYCVDCQERVSEDSGVQFGEVLLREHRRERREWD